VEDAAAWLTIVGPPEDGGRERSQGDGVAIGEEGAEHFIRAEHDAFHGAGTSFLDGISIA